MITTAAIETIRERAKLPDSTPVGIVSSSGLETKATESDRDRYIDVIANTSAVDLDREVVVPGGADISHFVANGKVFRDHRYGTDDCVGSIRREPKLVDGQWQVRIGLNRTAAGKTAWEIAKHSGIGVSIGFEPIDWGDPTEEEIARYSVDGQAPRAIVRKWRWLELSVTCMPCNVQCQSREVIEVESDGSKALGELVTKGAISLDDAKSFGFRGAPRVEVPRRQLILTGAGILERTLAVAS